jgi:hypothetical protein
VRVRRVSGPALPLPESVRARGIGHYEPVDGGGCSGIGLTQDKAPIFPDNKYRLSIHASAER